MAFRANPLASSSLTLSALPKPLTLGQHLKRYLLPLSFSSAEKFIRMGIPISMPWSYSRRKNIRRADFFDHAGYHPNIVSPSDRKATVTYIKKGNPTGDDIYQSGNLPDTIDKDAAWRAAVDATSAVEVHRIISKSHPKEYLIHHDKIEYFANKNNVRSKNTILRKTMFSSYLPKSRHTSRVIFIHGEFSSASSGRSRDRSSL